jgi:hypothetical protein
VKCIEAGEERSERNREDETKVTGPDCIGPCKPLL